MLGFNKSPTTVKVGPQLAEILEIQVKVRTPVGEFWVPHTDLPIGPLRPGDSIQFTWKWDGFRTSSK